MKEMISSRKSIIFLFLILLLILWNLIGHLIYKNYHNNIRNKEKMYCYETYWKIVNPALFVKNKQNIDSLISYYQKIEKGNLDSKFNFPPLLIPTDTCVYVLKYERDSMIAKIICYYKWGKQGDFVTGYVYKNTLHKNRPK
jgi:hypothetical protein